MASDLPDVLIRETPILMDALAHAVSTTPQDVAEHLAANIIEENLDDRAALRTFLDEYLPPIP